MHKRHPAPLARPALPAEEIAERLRAHARLCRQIAHESWDDTIAAELARLADQCVETADNIEPKPRSRLHWKPAPASRPQKPAPASRPRTPHGTRREPRSGVNT